MSRSHATPEPTPQTMLTHLRIQNLALVEDLSWELAPGLIGITGETGAGKSVIVGALKLLIGERADRSLLRAGSDQCTVEAVFQLGDTSALDAQLDEAGLAPCEGGQLVLKRSFSSAGANRQFVNCSPATLQLLKKLGDDLVDLHGPHDHQSLLARDRQLALLDAYAGAAKERTDYSRAWSAWQRAQREFHELRDAELAGHQEIELLRHQVSEIDAATLAADEENDLLERYRRSTHGARLAEAAGHMLDSLAEADESVLTRLAEAQRLARDIERLDPGMADRLQSLQTATVELEELADALRDYLNELEIDPAAARALEDRVNTLESLKRKYGPGIPEILAWREKAATRLSRIENRGEELARLEAATRTTEDETRRAAAKLSAKRRKAAPKLGKEIAGHLADLGFKRSEFEVSLETGAPGPHGTEMVEFLFMPNPGEPARPLRLIASSGEVSRVMLAVKSALAEQDAVPLLIFDEIDANVGGEIATAVGAKMASLARAHQVVTITHLPQVAAQAATHFVVTKEVADGRTRSLLEPVANEARVAELARMLGGKSKSALEHARALLAGT